jgi:hypothetical protein
MSKNNYLSGELTDDFLNAQADAGDYPLDEEGFQYRPTQDEMKKLALEGQSLLFLDCEKEITIDRAKMWLMSQNIIPPPNSGSGLVYRARP